MFRASCICLQLSISRSCRIGAGTRADHETISYDMDAYCKAWAPYSLIHIIVISIRLRHRHLPVPHSSRASAPNSIFRGCSTSVLCPSSLVCIFSPGPSRVVLDSLSSTSRHVSTSGSANSAQTPNVSLLDPAWAGDVTLHLCVTTLPPSHPPSTLCLCTQSVQIQTVLHASPRPLRNPR